MTTHDIPHSGLGTAHFLAVLIAIAILGYLVLPGLRWGLPSEERNILTFGADRSAWRAPPISEREKDSPWTYYPNYLSGGPKRTGASPRSAFNPLRSYHPDEYVFLKSLSAMKPSALKVFPGFFGWPALQFYVSGVALKVSSWFGAVTLVRDMDFYFQHPEQAARLYEVGRIVTLLFAAGCIFVIWRTAGRLFGAAGGTAAALLLAVTPLFTINARYWTADVPMLFWISLAFLFSTHILAGGGRRWYVLGGIAVGLAAATRYQGAAAASLIAAAHWMRPADAEAMAGKPDAGDWRERARRSFTSGDLWIAAAISLAVFLACNPYILARPGQFVQEFSGELKGSHDNWARFALDGAFSVVTGLGLIFLFAIFAASFLAAVRRDRAISFVLLGFGLPAAVLFVGRPAMARYWMPVLPLPVLLAAWAFATVHRHGVERRKPGAIVAPLILLVIVLVAMGLQSFAFARLYSDPQCDTRTRAGEWIAKSIPAGTTIGVLSEPWQFELPPLDSRKFVIRNPSDSTAHGPEDFLVMSDLQFAPEGRLQSEKEFLSGHVVIQRFEAWPVGQKLALRYGPQDMHYANPEIIIAERISKGGR
ncbi:MAG: ArnT family glycosyltransferase [Candidatus Brocadiia bacterium]